MALASALAALNMVMAFIILKETLPSKVRKQQSKNDVELQSPQEHSDNLKPASKTNYWELAKIMSGREFIFFYLGAVSANSASCVLDVVVPIAVSAKFGSGSTTVGWIWATYGIVVVIVQTFLVPKAKKYLGEKKTAIISQMGLAVAMMVVGLASNLPLEFVGTSLHAVWAGLYVPCLPALLSTRAPQGMQGKKFDSLSHKLTRTYAWRPVLLQQHGKNCDASSIWSDHGEEPRYPVHCGDGIPTVVYCMCCVDSIHWIPAFDTC